jgi:hypothetical protein
MGSVFHISYTRKEFYAEWNYGMLGSWGSGPQLVQRGSSNTTHWYMLFQLNNNGIRKMIVNTSDKHWYLLTLGGAESLGYALLNNNNDGFREETINAREPVLLRLRIPQLNLVR